MPTRKLSVILLLALSILYLFAGWGVQKLDKQWNRPVTLTLSLPLPQKFYNKYKIKQDELDVDKIIVTGFFSDWDPADSHYQMKKISDTKYKISLLFNPGENQYKYVLYQKDDPTPLWTEDPKAKKQVADSFGGVNSVISIPSVRPLKFALNFLLGGSIIILLLLNLLSPIVHWLMHLKMKLIYKLVISMGFSLLITSGVLIAYNIVEFNKVTRKTYPELLNVFHMVIKGEHLEYKLKNRAAIERVFDRFYRAFKARSRSDRFSNKQISINELVLFDSKLNVIATPTRDESEYIINRRLLEYGVTNIAQYYRQAVFYKAFEKIQKNPKNDREAVFIHLTPTITPTREYRFFKLFSSYTGILYPIIENHHLAGYFGALINVRYIGSQILQILIFNLIVSAVLTLLIAFLLFGIGNILMDSITTLIEWTNRIIQGDFQAEKTIHTKDELQYLAENFNKMRLSLRQNFEKINQQNAKLRELDLLKDQFLANTSHELRTPLNAIIGITELIQDEAYGDIAESLHKPLNLVLENAQNLNQLVSQILDFSKIKSGKIELNVSHFDIWYLIDLVIDLSRGLIKDRNIHFELRRQALPHVYGDKIRIRQILTNLIGNAIKFTPEGTVTISAAVEDPFLKVIIEDTGIGIKKEKIHTIFDEFQQSDGSAQREFEGTGLGLAITQTLVNLHRGKVDVYSQYGKGSRFSFTLPIRRDILIAEEEFARQTSQPVSASVPSALEWESYREPDKTNQPEKGKGERILIIDDDKQNLEVFKSRLEVEGYRVLTSEDPYHGFSLMESKSPDLVLLDIMMPGMSGYDFCQKKDEIPNLAPIPVVFVSAKGTVEDRIRAYQVGGNDFIGKPFDKEELLWKIRINLQRSAVLKEIYHNPPEKTKLISSDTSERQVINQNGNMEKILVIDEEDASREILKNRLSLHHYEVICASTAREGLLLAQKEHPNLILLDFMVSKLYGSNLLDKLKDSPQTKDIPILLVTPEDKIEEKIYAIQLGASDTIGKPTSKEELLSRINIHIEKAKSAQELSKIQKYIQTSISEHQKDLKPLLDQLEITNARLKELSLLDNLTGIANQKYFIENLENEWRRAIRSHTHLAVLMIDISHFEKLQSDYTTELVNQILTHFAVVIQSYLNRPGDLLARISESIFAIILPDTDKAGSKHIAEKILSTINFKTIEISDTLLQLKISIGGSTAFPEKSNNPHFDILIETANRALSASKEEIIITEVE